MRFITGEGWNYANFADVDINGSGTWELDAV